jgi:tetratricopeptide (TPR) repeat protein
LGTGVAEMSMRAIPYFLFSSCFALLIAPSGVHWPSRPGSETKDGASGQGSQNLKDKVDVAAKSASAKLSGSHTPPQSSEGPSDLYRLGARIPASDRRTAGLLTFAQPRKAISGEQTRMATAKYAWALTLLKQGKDSEAEKALREAIALNPDFLQAHFELGMLLAHQGTQQFNVAMDQFLEVLRLEPNHADARINLSRLLEKSGDIEASIAELKEAIPLASEKEHLYLMLGQKQQKARKYSEAIKSFRLALESNVHLSGAHYGIGMALRSLGNFAGAESEFECALKLNPQDPLSHYQLGRILEQEEDPSKAIAHLEEARRLQPDMAVAHAELGSLYKRINRTEESEKAFRQAISLNPNLVQACYGLAQLLHNDGRIEEANRFFQQVNQLKESQGLLEKAEKMNASGLELMNAGKLDEALAAFGKALGSCPSLAVAAYNQGVVLARQNKTQEAIDSFRMAVRSRPGFVLAQYALGLMLRLNGDPSAEEQLRKAQLMNKLVQRDEMVDRLSTLEDPD